MIYKNVFKTYFDRYDTDGNFHTGFAQSINLSTFVDITFLNDLTMAIVDSYLFNEYSNRVVLDRWSKFMRWDKDNKRFIIDPDFYTKAVNAMYVYLAKSEKFVSILCSDFSTLSAQEIEQINYGARTIGKTYGAQTIGRDYDKVTIELSRGTETENRGTHTDTQTRGAHTDNATLGAHTDTETHATYTDTENLGAHTDTETKSQYKDTENIGQRSDSESIGQRADSESIGAQTIGNTKTEQIHPYDAIAFVDDTKTIDETTNGAQSNSKTIGAQSNSKTTGAQSNETTHGAQETTNVLGAQSNSNVYGAREISNAHGAQSNSTAYGSQEIGNVYGAQENTRSYGKTTTETKGREDSETRGAHTDNQSISAYIDTKTRTKVLILSPDKYYQILKELADKNIYTLFGDAVNDTFLSDVYEFQALENGGVIL